jgi:hypothetical protein
MSTLFIWVVTPCGLVGRHQRSGETALKMETVGYYVSSKG